MAHAIGCDVGSQSLKGVLIGGDGNVAAEAAASYDMHFPKPGWADQDPADWLAALRQVVHALLATSGVDPADVGTIGLASQVDGLVAVDAAGRPLREAIIWMDRRAEEQTRRLGQAIDAEHIFEITGLNLDSSHVAPKILWLRDEHPELFAQATKLLLPGSYVVHHLTGEAVVDHSNASSTMLYDVGRRAWAPAMLDACELDPRLMARIAGANEVAGTLTAAAAAELGLRPGTRVVAGCGDEHGACLAAGLVRGELICDITGTAEPVAVAAARPVFDETGLVETHAHAHPDLWLIENPGFVSGGSLRWFSDNVAEAGYDELTAWAADVHAGCEGLVFLPCLSGAMTPTWNGNARGVFFGLAMNHDERHMARAVLEGCSFGLRDIVDRFTEMGIGGDEIRMVGGGAKSPLWCQMKADITGRTMETLAEEEATALGAAMLAGHAEGIYASLDEAAQGCTHIARVYEPDPAKHDAYEDAYRTYRRVYAALEPVFDAEEVTA